MVAAQCQLAATLKGLPMDLLSRCRPVVTGGPPLRDYECRGGRSAYARHASRASFRLESEPFMSRQGRGSCLCYGTGA